MLLGTSGGAEGSAVIGTALALAFAMMVGLVNGVLVAWLKLNALIVTLATGAFESFSGTPFLGAALFFYTRGERPQFTAFAPLVQAPTASVHCSSFYAM